MPADPGLQRGESEASCTPRATSGHSLKSSHLFPGPCKAAWNPLLILVLVSFLSSRRHCPVPAAPTEPGEGTWRQGSRRMAEDHMSNAETAEDLRWPSALYLTACSFKTNLLMGFLLIFFFFYRHPHEAFFPMSHAHHKEITVWLKVTLPCLESTFFQWEIGNELNLWVIHYLLFWPEKCFCH